MLSLILYPLKYLHNILLTKVLKTSILNKEDQVRINTKTWNKGVYFIQIRTNEQSYIQKLLIE